MGMNQCDIQFQYFGELAKRYTNNSDSESTSKQIYYNVCSTQDQSGTIDKFGNGILIKVAIFVDKTSTNSAISPFLPKQSGELIAAICEVFKVFKIHLQNFSLLHF